MWFDRTSKPGTRAEIQGLCLLNTFKNRGYGRDAKTLRNLVKAPCKYCEELPAS